MKKKAFISPALLGSLLMSTQLVFGQMGPGPHGPGVGGPGMGGPGMGVRGGPHLGKVVAGAPYSATMTNTIVQTLADGNTIQRTTTGTVARDSQGRTYSQETISGLFGQSGIRTITFIADPVAGYVYTLNPETKTATRRALHAPAEGAGGSENAPDRSKKWGGQTAPNVVTAELGSQMMNGVSVTGKTRTHTIPAGEMGNEKPIVATTETWYSPDLQVVVSSKRTDPREGTDTYALTNIQRAEPNAALFAVPSDYTVKDAPSFHGRP